MRQCSRGLARFAFVLFPLVLFVPLSGCGRAQGTVSGRVLYQDKPLPGGWITFQPADPKLNARTVAIGADGQYEVTLPAGEVQISVDNRELQAAQSAPPPVLPPEVKLPSPGGAGGAGAGARPGPKKQAGNYVAIPEKYYSSDTSGLHYTVTKGTQTHDIPLK